MQQIKRLLLTIKSNYKCQVNYLANANREPNAGIDVKCFIKTLYVYKSVESFIVFLIIAKTEFFDRILKSFKARTKGFPDKIKILGTSLQHIKTIDRRLAIVFNLTFAER